MFSLFFSLEIMDGCFKTITMVYVIIHHNHLEPTVEMYTLWLSVMYHGVSRTLSLLKYVLKETIYSNLCAPLT